MASYDTMHFFKVTADRLIKRGHTVKAFPAMPTNIKGGRYNVEQCNWHTFRMEPIESFAPNRIIIWNGYHTPFSAAVSYLKSTYHNVIHAEMAWLPQKGHIYYDTDNIGADSSIANKCFFLTGEASTKEKEIFTNLKKEYAPIRKPTFLPEKYIAVPLQLEMDTSITLHSPYFKTMDSLIGYALKMSPYPVVIKPHPKKMIDKRNFEKFKNISNVDLKDVIVVEKDQIDMNSLAAYSSGLIGINSTSMIEAALHFKPIIQLGQNVFRKKPFLMWDNKRAIQDALNIGKEHFQEIYIKKIAFLYNNQVNVINPQDWAIKKIEEFYHGPRMVQ